MHSEPDVTRIVRSWLHEGEHDSADRVLAIALAELDATPQRRATWPTRRVPYMNTYAKLAIAAVVVLAVAIVGIQLLPGRQGSVGGPAATPTPSPSPVADRMPPVGRLLPGERYTVVTDGRMLTFAVPIAGWNSDGSPWLKGHTGSREESYLWFVAGSGTPGVFTDACAKSGPRQFEDSIAGATQAIASEPGADLVAEPSDVTVDGRAAKSVAISIPEDVGCANTEYGMSYDPACSYPGCWYPTWLGSKMRFWTVDLGNGVRLVILAESRFSDASPDLEREIQQIVDSIQFE